MRLSRFFLQNLGERPHRAMPLAGPASRVLKVQRGGGGLKNSCLKWKMAGPTPSRSQDLMPALWPRQYASPSRPRARGRRRPALLVSVGLTGPCRPSYWGAGGERARLADVEAVLRPARELGDLLFVSRCLSRCGPGGPASERNHLAIWTLKTRLQPPRWPALSAFPTA